MFGLGVLFLASAAAQSAESSPYYNYNPGLSRTFLMWGEAVATVPLTDGWEYLFDGNRANGTTWASQQPGSQVAFRNREGRTVLQTSQPGQAYSLLFTGSNLTIGGTVTSDTPIDYTNPEYWQVYVDGELSPPSRYYMYNPTKTSDALFRVEGLQANTFHNVTIVTGPQFSGVLTSARHWWGSAMMREGNAALTEVILRGNLGNRLSFADGGDVQPILNTKGDVSVQQYEFQNAEKEAALVLKGDASIEMMVPANTSYLECEGYIGPEYGVVNFALDPPPPGNIGPSYMSRSTNRGWFAHDTMFSIALNPNHQYKFTVSTEAATAGAGVYLNSSNIFPFSNDAKPPFWIKQDASQTGASSAGASASGGARGGTSQNSNSSPIHPGTSATTEKTNVGAIAGGVIGGVLVAALIATAIFFFLRRRRRVDDTREKIDFTASDSMQDVRARVISPYEGGGYAAPPPHPKAYAALASRSSPSSLMPTDSNYDYFSQRMSYTPPGPSTQGSSQGDSSLVHNTKALFTPPVPSSDVVQERDGGAMPQMFVPPVYDPAWAQPSPRPSPEGQ